MRRLTPSRYIAVLTIGGLLIVVLVGVVTKSPVLTNVAWAQSEPITTVNGIQIPPPVPGLDYEPVDIGANGPAQDLVMPGTPVPPMSSPDGSTVVDAPESSGALTTSLGGSDIAVSSVGGSYEVDSPKKRRSNRNK